VRRRRHLFSHSSTVDVGHIKAFFSATRALPMVPQTFASSTPRGSVLHDSSNGRCLVLQQQRVSEERKSVQREEDKRNGTGCCCAAGWETGTARFQNSAC